MKRFYYVLAFDLLAEKIHPMPEGVRQVVAVECETLDEAQAVKADMIRRPIYSGVCLADRLPVVDTVYYTLTVRTKHDMPAVFPKGGVSV